MLRLIKNSLEFVKYLDLGFKHYQEYRLEFLTLTKNKDNPSDMKQLFLKFVDVISHHKWGIMDCQYCGVIVDNQHIHVIIRKPFQKIEHMTNTWNKILNEHSSLKIKTIKKSSSSYEKLIRYTSEQSFHHDLPVEYFQSEKWGIEILKKKTKKSKSEENKVWTWENGVHVCKESKSKRTLKQIKKSFFQKEE